MRVDRRPVHRPDPHAHNLPPDNAACDRRVQSRFQAPNATPDRAQQARPQTASSDDPSPHDRPDLYLTKRLMQREAPASRRRRSRWAAARSTATRAFVST
jgi:hypothetical protein